MKYPKLLAFALMASTVPSLAASIGGTTAATTEAAEEIVGKINAVEADRGCKKLDHLAASILTGEPASDGVAAKNDASGVIKELWLADACGQKRIYVIVLRADGASTKVERVAFVGNSPAS